MALTMFFNVRMHSNVNVLEDLWVLLMRTTMMLFFTMKMKV